MRDTTYDFSTERGWKQYCRDKGWTRAQALEQLRDHEAMIRKMVHELRANGKPHEDLIDQLLALKPVIKQLAEPASSRTFTTSRGDTFTTDLTDREAIALLGRCRSNFALSLHGQYTQRGSLSDKQWPWVHKLALEQRAREEGATEREVATLDLDFTELVAMLKRAGESLKRPRVRLPIGGGEELLFSLTSGGKVPGSINVSERRSDRYMGRIMPDGTMRPTSACTDDYVAVLRAVADDPGEVLATAGRMSGSCCFCARELTTEESTSAGYGPVCADKYGLPWG